jgi:acetyl esterase/lipase
MFARPIAPRRPPRFARAATCFAIVVALVVPASGQQAKEKAKEKADAKAKSKAKAAMPDLPPKTFADVPYGDHPRQVLDFWKAETREPAPLAIFIHGGGWNGGDKSRPTSLDVKKLLANGISVAAINYRLVPQATEEGIKPPVKWPLEDAARAVQFLRSKATDWNIDRTRLGANGSSAGACSSLWLALHDDMARPRDADPIARESTRLTCAAVVGAQTELDPHLTRAWMPNMGYGGHAFGFKAADGKSAFQQFYDHRDEVLPWLKEYSPYPHAGPGDPPVFLDYPSQKKPAREGEEQADPTHSAVLGLKLQEKLQKAGCEARLSYPGHQDPQYANSTEFLIAKLKPARP